MNSKDFRVVADKLASIQGISDAEEYLALHRKLRQLIEKVESGEQLTEANRKALPAFRLLSKHKERADHHGGICIVCNEWGVRLYRYWRTSWGDVRICEKCQAKAEFQYNPKSSETEVNLRFDGSGWRK